MLSRDLLPRRELDPVEGDELLVAPSASTQQELAEGGDGLGREVEAVEPEGGAVPHPVPFGVVDPHRMKDAVVEQAGEIASRDSFDHARQDVGGRVVVGVACPLRLGERHPQEALHEVPGFQSPRLIEAVRVVAGRHGQQVMDIDAPALVRDVGRDVIRQDVHHQVV